jgi:hypothetical protein
MHGVDNSMIRTSLLAGIFAWGTMLNASSAFAQAGPQASAETPAPKRVATAPVPRVAKPYFIEFRARQALSYGHTFVVHGRVGAKLTNANVVGLHPFTESSVPWMIGHLVFVPSETGASDGDIEDQYIIAKYRILLSEPEYRKLTAFMKDLKTNSPMWHAVLYNCNSFVGDIAKSMGLKAPSSNLLMPKEYITELKQINVGGPRPPPTTSSLAAAATRSSVD